jgi:hypothetical protein
MTLNQLIRRLDFVSDITARESDLRSVDSLALSTFPEAVDSYAGSIPVARSFTSENEVRFEPKKGSVRTAGQNMATKVHSCLHLRMIFNRGSRLTSSLAYLELLRARISASCVLDPWLNVHTNIATVLRTVETKQDDLLSFSVLL